MWPLLVRVCGACRWAVELPECSGLGVFWLCAAVESDPLALPVPGGGGEVISRITLGAMLVPSSRWIDSGFVFDDRLSNGGG